MNIFNYFSYLEISGEVPSKIQRALSKISKRALGILKLSAFKSNFLSKTPSKFKKFLPNSLRVSSWRLWFGLAWSDLARCGVVPTRYITESMRETLFQSFGCWFAPHSFARYAPFSEWTFEEEEKTATTRILFHFIIFFSAHFFKCWVIVGASWFKCSKAIWNRKRISWWYEEEPFALLFCCWHNILRSCYFNRAAL